MKTLMSGSLCLAMILAPVLSASADTVRPVKQQTAVSDVTLSDAGTLNGKAVDGQGKPLQGTKVSIRKNQEVVATVVTDEEGKFQVSGLDTGIYELQAGQGKGVIRAWNDNVAPPTSKKNILIVSGATARGQSGLFVDPLQTTTLILSVTGVALGAAALSDNGETRIIVSP
ncbi:MAG: carboxypeptidase regulatory-like domain-containing protein [Planctomycetaceae bacterium]|nr:carboxypeptidase regulatory-like domain-containing protein [Planctomycetaceae bacterium]